MTTRSSAPVFSMVCRGVEAVNETRGAGTAGSARESNIVLPCSSRRTKSEPDSR